MLMYGPWLKRELSSQSLALLPIQTHAKMSSPGTVENRKADVICTVSYDWLITVGVLQKFLFEQKSNGIVSIRTEHSKVIKTAYPQTIRGYFSGWFKHVILFIMRWERGSSRHNKTKLVSQEPLKFTIEDILRHNYLLVLLFWNSF